MFYDVVIIGGGASGLFAASVLSRLGSNMSVAVIEKHPRVGKKLIATGNGTCNIANINGGDPAFYHGDSSFAKTALTRFPPASAMSYFDEIGLLTDFSTGGFSSGQGAEPPSVRDGRIYPVSRQASAVLDCLRLSFKNVTELCGVFVTRVLESEGKYRIIGDAEDGKKELSARYVIIATGGIAAPSLGGGSNAYDILLELGYSKTPLMPSVVQIKTDTEFIKSVKGIRVDAGVTLKSESKAVSNSVGELLFTEYGLSGPVILDISRSVSEWEYERGSGKAADLFAEIDLVFELSLAEVKENIARRAKLGRDVENLLTGFINKRVGQMVLRYVGIANHSLPAEALSGDELDKIAGAIKAFRVKVGSTRGFSNAQVTAGGIKTDSFNPETMESKRHKNIFVTGEVLNVDGDCGGFNLGWAWASGYAAASEIARRG